MPPLSTNSVRYVVHGATHESLVAQRDNARLVARAIRNVIGAALAHGPWPHWRTHDRPAGRRHIRCRQRAKLIELTNQYGILGADGTHLGYVEQDGQSTARKVLRFVTDVDQFLTHRLGIS